MTDRERGVGELLPSLHLVNKEVGDMDFQAFQNVIRMEAERQGLDVQYVTVDPHLELQSPEIPERPILRTEHPLKIRLDVEIQVREIFVEFA